MEKNGNQPGTPGKKKGKSEKAETPSKSRKRVQEKPDEAEQEEKELGLFKKKRDRAEVTTSLESRVVPYAFFLFQSPSSVTTDSGSINDEVENNEAESETSEAILATSSSNSNISSLSTSVVASGANPPEIKVPKLEVPEPGNSQKIFQINFGLINYFCS